ncbi:MAG: hypothetical protein NTV51_05675 [Verrucomicrobia bacterium]|nr:hypothetical protein [Verrucomicrobiota bacterium]
MEIFGLLFALPVTLGASASYTWLAIRMFGRWPRTSRVAVAISHVVAGLVVLEVILLLAMGAKDAFRDLRHTYTTLHIVNFLLAPPAVANLALHFTPRSSAGQRRFKVATLCCWLTGMTVLVGNIVVDETITGTNNGRPFYLTRDNGGPGRSRLHGNSP